MNGGIVDLYSFMKFHKADIVKDCSPSCDPNPCKNSAMCMENWGSFTCQCSNPWAQTGTLCEKGVFYWKIINLFNAIISTFIFRHKH